jgi:hypothetical protein
MSVDAFAVLRRGALIALIVSSSGLLVAQSFRGPRSGPAPALNATPPGGLQVGTFPGITEAQMFFYQQALNLDFQMVELAVTNARSELARASLTIPRDDAAIAAAVAKLAAADLAAALKKAEGFTKVQAGPNKLNATQKAALVANGGRYTGGGGIGGGNASTILPADFKDHEGYRSLFDGASLKGWDGNPKFWRVEDGVIVGESTAQNPSGNTYIMYRDIEAHDFTLKMEIRIDGSGGSGIQYRSKTNLPWFANISANIANNNGPVNLDWMTTGPQADFWPTTTNTGQTYSENTPMRIQIRRGFVGEGFGYGPRRQLGTVGDPAALQSLIKLNDWNEYTVIARGPVAIHIINGATMAVMIDDDPKSSNNWSGQIGVELEATGKISFRNVWLKKLN